MGTTMDQTGPLKVIQVTNIAPQATKDQMLNLFSFVGKVEDIRLYPSVRDANVTIRCCFVKFNDSSCIPIAQHLTNTVFIDRAIIVTPVQNGDVPDEQDGMVMATLFQQQGVAGNGLNRLGGPGMNGNILSSSPVVTPDKNMESLGLPPYPVLPAGTPMGQVDEIRRTVTLVGIDSTVSAQACMEMFSEAGEVKYFRYCTRLGDPVKYALIEFTNQDSVGRALQLNERILGMTKIKVTHATQAIKKPHAKTSEAVQREIEEAMSKVKETQSLVSAAVDPLMGMLGGTSGRSSRTRSRSRSRERSYHNSRRSRSRDRERRRGGRSRSRSRDRKKSKSHEQRRRSRDRKRPKKSRSKSKERRRRSRSKDKKKETEKEKSVEPQAELAETVPKKSSNELEETSEVARSLSKKRSRSPSKRRSRSPSKRKSRSPSKRKSRSPSKRKSRSPSKRPSRSPSKKRSKSRERKKKPRSKSRERKRSKSRDRKSRRSASRERRKKRSRSRKRSKDRSSKSSSKKVKDSTKSTEDMKESSREEIEEKKDDDMEISNSP